MYGDAWSRRKGLEGGCLPLIFSDMDLIDSELHCACMLRAIVARTQSFLCPSVSYAPTIIYQMFQRKLDRLNTL